jgi:hypothetical protein
MSNCVASYRLDRDSTGEFAWDPPLGSLALRDALARKFPTITDYEERLRLAQDEFRLNEQSSGN